MGNAKPIGICDCGYIDAMAELLKSGLINRKGTFLSKMSERLDILRKGPNGWEIVVAKKGDTNLETDIVITQLDIRELQKAKAAIHAGVEILIKKNEHFRV